MWAALALISKTERIGCEQVLSVFLLFRYLSYFITNTNIYDV